MLIAWPSFRWPRVYQRRRGSVRRVSPAVSLSAPAATPVLVDQHAADGIAEFVVRHWPVPLIVAHCEAGISRSAGVVAAINDWMPEKLTVIQTGVPNRLVWRLVREALMRRTITGPPSPTE